jgi:hypothetical protein
VKPHLQSNLGGKRDREVQIHRRQIVLHLHTHAVILHCHRHRVDQNQRHEEAREPPMFDERPHMRPPSIPPGLQTILPGRQLNQPARQCKRVRSAAHKSVDAHGRVSTILHDQQYTQARACLCECAHEYVGARGRVYSQYEPERESMSASKYRTIPEGRPNEISRASLEVKQVCNTLGSR